MTANARRGPALLQPAPAAGVDDRPSYPGHASYSLANKVIWPPAALQLCKTNPPDLVLLDVVMPQMDGY
jgi:CheY-like chemotaxis protein